MHVHPSGNSTNSIPAVSLVGSFPSTTAPTPVLPSPKGGDRAVSLPRQADSGGPGGSRSNRASDRHSGHCESKPRTAELKAALATESRVKKPVHQRVRMRDPIEEMNSVLSEGRIQEDMKVVRSKLGCRNDVSEVYSPPSGRSGWPQRRLQPRPHGARLQWVRLGLLQAGLSRESASVDARAEAILVNRQPAMHGVEQPAKLEQVPAGRRRES